MSTGGVVPYPLVPRTLLTECNVGSTTSSDIFVSTIFRFLKVPLFSFLTFHLFSSIPCSVSFIYVTGIL